MAARARRANPRPYLLRLVRGRPRLFSAAGLLLIVAVALPIHEWSTRLLIAWDVAIAAYLGMVIHLMRGATVKRIRERAEAEDEGRFGILILTVGAALASLIAIVAELAGAQGATKQNLARVAMALLTILLSWAFIHVIFAFHYAHEFYSERGGHDGPALQFPGGEDPDYWDFAYFSFVIGMTSQVSDVDIACRSIRRTATAHGITSFLFNIALLSLMINIAAGFVTSN